MNHRIYDAAALQAMRPLVRRIVDDLVRAFDEVLQAATRGDGSIDAELAVVEHHVEELEALGGTVPSLDPVRIEFLAIEQGELGYLPWCPVANRALAFRSAEAPVLV